MTGLRTSHIPASSTPVSIGFFEAAHSRELSAIIYDSSAAACTHHSCEKEGVADRHGLQKVEASSGPTSYPTSLWLQEGLCTDACLTTLVQLPSGRIGGNRVK